MHIAAPTWCSPPLPSLRNPLPPPPPPQLPNTPDWTDTSRLVAFTLHDGKGGGLYVAFNTSHLPKLLQLPKWGGRVWQPLVDTSKVRA